MIFEKQNKVKFILQRDQDRNSQLQQIKQIFLNDQFSTIQELEDILLEEASNNLHQDCSLALAFILMTQCANDKYRIDQTYQKLFAHYLKNENCSHLIDIISFLLNYFQKYVYFQGDKLFTLLISQDKQKIQKIINLLKAALRPQKNQVISLELSIQKLNSIQNNIADVEDIFNLADALLRFAQKTMFNGKVKNNNQVEKIDDKSEEQFKIDALNILFLLRNKLNKQQKKKTIVLLISNINQIEDICDNDLDLMIDYLYFLKIIQEDFHKQKELLVLEKMSEILNQYLKNITINDFIYQMTYKEKFPFSKQLQNSLLQLSQLEGQEDRSQEINNIQEIFNNQERFLLAKSTVYDITVGIFFSQKRKKIIEKNSQVLFEIILSLSKLCFSLEMVNENVMPYDTELSSCLQGVYDLICEEKKNQFLYFIYQKLADIDKKTEIINGVTVQVEIEDKFVAIGCYIILEYLSSKLVEDMKGYALKFMNFISYHILDDYIFPSVNSFLAEMANYFTSNISAYHKNFMPQLVLIIKSTQSTYKKEVITDSFIKIYDQLIYQRVKDMYPYLKDIFQFLVKEYTSKNFFEYINQYTDTIQILINLIISLKDIELYLKEEILDCADAFVNMMNDPQERTKLIAKNHQQVLYGFLCFQQKQGKVSEKLLSQIIGICDELAQKMYSEGDKLDFEQKSVIYIFLKKLNVFTLGSQEIFDKIMLLVLPQVLKDAQTDVTIKGYQAKQRDNNIDQEGLDDLEIEDENQGEQEENFDVDQYDQFNYWTPSEDKLNLVEQSLTILAVFSEQSPELFFSHKKYDILKILITVLDNPELTEDIIILSQSVIGRIVVSVQKYLISLENQDEQGLSQSQLVELNPLIDILLLRFQEQRYHLFVSRCEDRLYQELNTTIEKLDKKTVFSYFNRFYSMVESLLYDNVSTFDSNKIGNCIYSIIDILKATPSKIMEVVPQTWEIIKFILTQKELEYEAYEEYVEILNQQKNQQNIIKQEDNFAESFIQDPFIVIRCIFETWEIIRLCPEAYTVYHPLFHYIILNQDFSQYEQYLQSICAYLKRIVIYSQSYLNVEDIKAYHQILSKIAKKVDEKYFMEISPVENLRIAFAMLEIYLDNNIPQQQKNQQKESYKLFLQIIPLRDEITEFPQVVYIIYHLIQNKYEFNVIEKNNVILSILRAIDNPVDQEIDNEGIKLCLRSLKLLCQSEYDRQILIKHIDQKMNIYQKNLILSYLDNVNQPF